MSEDFDNLATSSIKAKSRYQTRPISLRRGYEAVFPIVRLKEPYYGDTTCHHSPLCGINRSTQATEATIEHLLKPAIWQSTYPLPVYEGVLAEAKTDICLDLAKRKKSFTRNLHSIKQNYHRKKSKMENELLQIPNDNVNTIMVNMFAEALERDPDKYFNGAYDWYFTGGSMDTVDVNGQKFLIHSEGNELQNIRISKLNTDCSISPTNIFDKNLRSLYKGKTIYEIQSIAHKPFFTVRQKHQLSVINLRSDNLRILKINSDIPLVASAADASMKLIFIDAKQSLQLFNFINVKPIGETKVFANQMTIDNWTSVRFIDQNQFVCASRKIISFYDIRQSMTPIITRDLTASMGPCEDVTCMEYSSNSHSIFISTTHKLQALDIRNIPNETTPTLTWVHQLKTSPVMIDTCKKDDSGELIAIAGIKSGDVKVFDTKTSDTESISTHLPYAPLNLHESLRYAKSIGKLLDPNSLVQCQIRQSNSGVKLNRINANKFALLIKNTCGDVLRQNIELKVEHFSPEPIVDGLVEWDKRLRRRRHRENKLSSKVSDITNLQPMAAFLQSNMQKGVQQPTVQPASTEKQEWQMSVEELASYQDVLANSLLDKWLITQDVDDVQVDEKFTGERMNDWIDSTVGYHIFQEDICVKGEPEIQEY